MSSNSEQNSKISNSQGESDSGTEEGSSNNSSEYDGESGEEFVILSDDELLTDGELSSANEKDYFGSPSNDENSEQTEVAWEDSDDNVELREEMDDEAKWLNSEGIKKIMKKNSKKIFFKLTRKIFTAKCKVKLFKVFPKTKILVDSFNLIYFINSFEDYKTYKIDFFKVTDVCYFADKYLFSSNTTPYLKQITTEGRVNEFKKTSGNIKRMISDENLYILADKIYAFNKNINLINEFTGNFVDFCVTTNAVVCLKIDGDILVFDKELNFINKIDFPFKFTFKSLHSVEDKVIVCTADGMIILDSNFSEIKSYSNLTSPITSLTSNKDFIVHGSAYQNSIRIMRHLDLGYFDKFPFSKIKINSISTMSFDEDTVYFSDSKFINALQLKYI